MTIRVERQCGETIIRVGLVPDPDDLPHEHETRHKALVGKLLPPGGQGRAREAGHRAGGG